MFNGFWRDEGRGSTATICSGTSSGDTPPRVRNIISCLVWWHVGYNQTQWRVEMLEYTHTCMHVRAHMCAPRTNTHTPCPWGPVLAESFGWPGIKLVPGNTHRQMQYKYTSRNMHITDAKTGLSGCKQKYTTRLTSKKAYDATLSPCVCDAPESHVWMCDTWHVAVNWSVVHVMFMCFFVIGRAYIYR